MNNELLIQLALGIPLFCSIAVWAFRSAPDARETVTMLSAISLFIVALSIAMRVNDGQVLVWNVAEAMPGFEIAFKVEPLGALFGCIASGLWGVNSLYSIGYMRGNKEQHQTRFYMCFGIALFGAMGAAFSANLFTLFVFYEVLTFSTYPLVTHKGDENALRGGRIYMKTLVGTSVGLFLVGIIGTYVVTGMTPDGFIAANATTDFIGGGILNGHASLFVGSVLLLLFVFGIGKAAIMPFHFWLPNAMVAPTPVSALLHAVAVVKTGVFAVLKIATYIFGADYLSSLPGQEIVLVVACFTIIVSSLIALTKDNLKARLAYSTVSQLSYVTVGAMLASGAAMMGGGLQIAMHAVGKITLFMCAGAIYVATGKGNISEMRGLGRKMPIVFTCFLVGALSIIGVPPMGGSWAKYQLIVGSLEADKVYVAWTLIASSILNVIYLIPIAILALMPPKGSPEPAAYKREGGTPPLAVIPPAITAVLCVVMFFGINTLYDFLLPVFGSRP